MKWNWTSQREEAAELVARDDLTDQEIADKIGITKRTLENWKLERAFLVRVDQLVQAFRERVRARGIAIVEERVYMRDTAKRELQQIVAARKAAAVDQKQLHEECQAKIALLVPERDALSKQLQDRKEERERLPGHVDEIAEAEEAADREELKRLNELIDGLEHTDPGPLQPGQETGHLIQRVTYTKMGKVVEWVEDLALIGELRALAMDTARDLGQLTEHVKHSGRLGVGFVDLTKVPTDRLDLMEQILEEASPDPEPGSDPG